MISSSILPSFIIRCRLTSDFSIHSIQISNNYIQINHYIHHRQSISDIDFNITINKTNQNNIFEIDLATIILKINSTNSILPINWYLLSSNNSNQSILQIPIHVQYDNIQTIVALTDFTSLINTAMLSMQTQQYPLKILAVNHSGSIQSVSQAVCHSENVHLIQVDASCNHIYFSGHERDDFFDHINSPTSIVIRYDKYIQRVFFTIYIPERPLRIELSDTKLSRINGWFVINREDNGVKSESSTNGVEDEDDEDDDDDDEDIDDDVKCYPVYQQSNIHVFTKFYRTTQSKI
jgi:hypothetical protein